jgi:Zn finger protein HypA/HybF involved in hydrogenase expression
MYVCQKCKKSYSKQELINYQLENGLVKKYGLRPVCPNCESVDFKIYELTKLNNN